MIFATAAQDTNRFLYRVPVTSINRVVEIYDLEFGLFPENIPEEVGEKQQA